MAKLPWRTSLFLAHVGDYCEESMIFNFDSYNPTTDREVTSMIKYRGGFIVDRYEDDPHTIVFCNNEPGNDESTNQRSYDRFDIKFVRDSFEVQKLQDLNKYLIKPSLFSEYDANEILHRKRKWSDLQRKNGTTGRPDDKRKPSQSTRIDSGKQKSLELILDRNDAKTPSKSAVKTGENTLKSTENSGKVVNSASTDKKDENNSSGYKLRSMKKSMELFTADEIEKAFEISDCEGEGSVEITDDEDDESSHSIVERDKSSEFSSTKNKEKGGPSALTIKDKEKKKAAESAAKNTLEPSPRLNVAEKDSSKLSGNEKEKPSESPVNSLEKVVIDKPTAKSPQSPVKNKQTPSKSIANDKTTTSSNLESSETRNSVRKRNIFTERDSSTPPAPMPIYELPGLRKRKTQVQSEVEISDSIYDFGDNDSNVTTSVKPKQRREKGTEMRDLEKETSRSKVSKSVVIDSQKPTCSKYFQNKEKEHASKSAAKNTRKNTSTVAEMETSSPDVSEKNSPTAHSQSKIKETTLTISKDKPTENSFQSAVTKHYGKSFKSAGNNAPTNRPTNSKPSTASKTSSWVSQIVGRGRSPTPEQTSPKKRQTTQPESPPGSPVSGFSSDSEHNVSVANTNNTTKTIRREYTETDRITILKFIVSNKFYRYTRGNKIWEHLAELKLLPGRSGPSLKEHFRKQIKPRIKTFDLPSSVLKEFEKAEKFLDLNKRVSEVTI